MTILSRRRDGGVPFQPQSIARVFDEFFNEPLFSIAPSLSATSGPLAVDLSENDQSVIVRASLPGFTKDQISVEVHDGILSINAQDEHESEETTERYHRRERRVGSMSRQVALPSSVVAHQTQAELKDGVLTLRLPKVPEAQPRKIEIK